jgi:hypothetical protein
MILHLLCTLLMADAALVSDQPGLAALNIDAERGVDASLVKLLSDAVLSHLKSSQQFSSVIGSSDIQAMISMEQQKQALGCDEDSCLAQLGGALGVPYLLIGSLGTVGGRFMLNLKLLQVEDARVAERVTKVFADESALLDGLEEALGNLIRGVKAAQPKGQKTPAVAAQESAGRAKPMLLSGSLVGVGVGAVAVSYVVVRGAQNDHDEAVSLVSAESLASAVSTGNMLLYAGLGSVAAGVVAWVW